MGIFKNLIYYFLAVTFHSKLPDRKYFSSKYSSTEFKFLEVKSLNQKYLGKMIFRSMFS